MFAFRRMFSPATAQKCYSTGGGLVNLTMSDTGVALVELNRPPVNTLSTEMLRELHQTLCHLEENRAKGMVLTSTAPKVFTAGLDLTEIYNSPVETVRRFWNTLQDTWIKLYSTPYPTVAAINGHSPAGGCLFGMSCEYRIIVPNVKIGLNETLLGVVAPPWFQDCMKNIIGERQAEKALIAGTMFTSEEALRVGLVDEIAADKQELLEKSNKFLKGQINLPALARKTVKQTFRKSTLSKLINGREADTQEFLAYILQPKVQEGLGKYLSSLKKK